MDRKTWLGFLAGVALAGGASFLWTHRAPVVAPQASVSVVAQPAVQKVAEPQSPAPPAVTPAAQPNPKIASRNKPPVQIAKVEKEPPAPPPETASLRPAPAPEPPPGPVPTPVDARPIDLAPPPIPVTVPVAAPKPEPGPPGPHTVTIPSGTLLDVRVLERLSSDRNVAGDTFMITLDQALVVDGFVIAERGAHGEGRVVEVNRARRLHGLPFMSLELTRISTSDGQNVAIRTAPAEREGTESKKGDAAKVGAGAVLGSVIGAASGGGKGAAIGAAAGAAAGIGTVMATRGKPAVVQSESRLSFRLQEPVSLTEQLGR